MQSAAKLLGLVFLVGSSFGSLGGLDQSVGIPGPSSISLDPSFGVPGPSSISLDPSPSVLDRAPSVLERGPNQRNRAPGYLHQDPSHLDRALLTRRNPLLGDQSQAMPRTITPEDSYSSVHRLRTAHELTLGRGAKVGVLDHSFGVDAHPELYAGFQDLQPRARREGGADESYHGYWMALALHEVAPEAQIFALNTFSPDETERVEAVVRALDWAIANDLDVVTHCAGGFSPEARAILDPAVERAVQAGVIVVFLNYEHPLNLLPAVMGQRFDGAGRAPDLNIFSYDCTLDLGDITVGLLDTGDKDLVERRPFLSRSSAAPVAAGLAALVRSMDPETSPTQVKEVLRGTSRSVRIKGMAVAHVPDAFRAVTQVAGIPTVKPSS